MDRDEKSRIDKGKKGNDEEGEDRVGKKMK